jgi:thiamine-monophosphate kinase
LGPGDDAAVLRLADGAECAVTVDLLTDGVDFRIGEVAPGRVGRKALAVSISDIAAMAARPLAAVIALALPRRGGKQLAIGLYEGLIPLAEKYDMSIAGGDINSWDGPLVISTTVIGQITARGPLCRHGARPGDRIVVTGQFGGSILGRHLDFDPRVDEALWLTENYDLRAGIDVSDGLSLDLSRLAAESGCGAVIDLALVPVADAARELSRQQGATEAELDSAALEHALSDGEDFELILAVAPEDAAQMIADQPLSITLTDIGQFIDQRGLWQIDADGRRCPLEAKGYLH